MGTALPLLSDDDREPDRRTPEQRARDHAPSPRNPHPCWKNDCPEQQTDITGCPSHGIG
ncbi:hypothetical protein SAMN05421803_101884 [Nocardiopsis flavescens]|uniref:Uncharacterized protein n=1 Tax=Nocardiopsis flavescens TaxID=758803 RepID=A0A1M6D0Q6_9ACTN|nr:hypothetical protein [Nocardiopsis flavescens]SHI66836.1 hypothetical protein SAMN05421803_101884 [Nocardiopsis flavescens]